jgi:hypothetical protein
MLPYLAKTRLLGTVRVIGTSSLFTEPGFCLTSGAELSQGERSSVRIGSILGLARLHLVDFRDRRSPLAPRRDAQRGAMQVLQLDPECKDLGTEPGL